MGSKVSVRGPDDSIVQMPLNPQIVDQAASLIYKHQLYFVSKAAMRLIPVSQLVLSRLRPEGVANALIKMSEAANGQRSRRDPVTVASFSLGTPQRPFFL